MVEIPERTCAQVPRCRELENQVSVGWEWLFPGPGTDLAPSLNSGKHRVWALLSGSAHSDRAAVALFVDVLPIKGCKRHQISMD